MSSHLFVIVCYSVFKVRKLRVPSVRSAGGDSEIRTRDPLLARQVLSQLSYTPGESFTRQSLLDGNGQRKPNSASNITSR